MHTQPPALRATHLPPALATPARRCWFPHHLPPLSNTLFHTFHPSPPVFTVIPRTQPLAIFLVHLSNPCVLNTMKGLRPCRFPLFRYRYMLLTQSFIGSRSERRRAPSQWRPAHNTVAPKHVRNPCPLFVSLLVAGSAGKCGELSESWVE